MKARLESRKTSRWPLRSMVALCLCSLLLFALFRFDLCACVHCFPDSSAQHWRSVCVSPNAIVQEFIRTQYAAAKMRHPGKKATLSDRKCSCWTFPAPPHPNHHSHTLPHSYTSLSVVFCKLKPMKMSLSCMLSFSYQACSGLDGCQGAVHGLSAETDDILLKASIDPVLGSLRG